MKNLVTMFRAAFPDLHSTVDLLIAEGDIVVGRHATTGTHRGEFMGIPATNKQVSISEIHIVRIANGKAVEHWGNQDDMGMMQQLGLIPEG
jgi:predicted ester cyclase